ncbi:AbaSI family restriction endonuclease [Microbacterium sp. 22215]|uniref:AbaSI family restriction endonuclease n=1 Tax=Microbacterium sp. 22215 TaxID=3453893 RepID=UPI003F82B294
MSTTVEDSASEKPTRTPWTMPTEVDYYGKMLRSIRGKKYEVYAVSRIMHLLDDPEIELVTQKPVRRADGSLSLLDLYLPQFNVGVEVDELHHLLEGTREHDQAREQAITEVSDIRHPLEHLSVESTDPLNTLKERTDELIARIREWKAEAISAGTFVPFNYGDRYTPSVWRERGKVTLEDDIQMPRATHVVALFGHITNSQRKATYRLGENFQVWMPELHQADGRDRDDWKNVLSEDGQVITQIELDEPKHPHNPDMRNVVFAKYRHPVFNDTYYRFLGVFAVSGIDDTGRVVTLRREATEIDLSPYAQA